MNTSSVLVSWLGITDVKASKGLEQSSGPLCQAVLDRKFDHVAILSDLNRKDEEEYLSWIHSKTKLNNITITHYALSSPTEYPEIYEGAVAHIKETKDKFGEVQFTFHLSPGTPAMAAVWIIISKSVQPAVLIDSSLQKGVRTVSFPFEVYAEYISKSQKIDSELNRVASISDKDKVAFESILTKSDKLKILIAKAIKIAKYNVPVLIYGESGTGKELFAKAIHTSSSRCDKSFVPVNCGAIPSNLFEAEFFGYIKGAFTGAVKEKKGYIETAHQGTLFLDEIGEMPLNMQVKLLRAIQEGIIRRVGSTDETKIDIRIIAATNKNLFQEIQENRFREDLFHRISIGMLNLPPLRERKEDINLLTDYFLSKLNETHKESKNISVSARNIMINHGWPGNIRELKNTVERIFIWALGNSITDKEVSDNLLPVVNPNTGKDSVLNRAIEANFKLDALLEEIEMHYINRVLKMTDKKIKASELLGYNNHQTLNNKLKKYGLE